MNLLPSFPLPNGYNTANQYLIDLVLGGANRLYKDTFTLEVTIRIKRELAIIRRQEMADYFLIYWDLARFAKENNILFDCSVGKTICGIVPYCLGITTIDPIQAGFLSEHFLYGNEDRLQLFFSCQESRKDEVVSYLFSKFGEDYVSYMQTSSSDGKYQGLRTGQILITPLPLKNYFTLTEFQGKIVPEKYSKEIYEAGFSIFYVDGKSKLDKMAKILASIPDQFDLTQIPLDNQDVLDELYHPSIKSTWYMRKRKEVYFPEIQEKTFDNLVAMYALMNQDDDTAIYTYIQCVNKCWKPVERHPLLAPFLRSTYGVWVYPEQTLEMLKNVCELKDTEAYQLYMYPHPANEQMKLYKQKVRENAEKRGLSEEDIEELFRERWSRKWKAWKKDSYLECLNIYQDTWLKVHYPNEYANAINNL